MLNRSASNVPRRSLNDFTSAIPIYIGTHCPHRETAHTRVCHRAPPPRSTGEMQMHVSCRTRACTRPSRAYERRSSRSAVAAFAHRDRPLPLRVCLKTERNGVSRGNGKTGVPDGPRGSFCQVRKEKRIPAANAVGFSLARSTGRGRIGRGLQGRRRTERRRRRRDGSGV